LSTTSIDVSEEQVTEEQVTEEQATEQVAEEFVPGDVPYEETVRAVKSLFETQAVTAGAINRLETFVFSITKILKDADTLSLERLGFLMEELANHQTLDSFWEVAKEVPKKKVRSRKKTVSKKPRPSKTR